MTSRQRPIYWIHWLPVFLLRLFRIIFIQTTIHSDRDEYVFSIADSSTKNDIGRAHQPCGHSSCLITWISHSCQIEQYNKEINQNLIFILFCLLSLSLSVHFGFFGFLILYCFVFGETSRKNIVRFYFLPFKSWIKKTQLTHIYNPLEGLTQPLIQLTDMRFIARLVIKYVS